MSGEDPHDKFIHGSLRKWYTVTAKVAIIFKTQSLWTKLEVLNELILAVCVLLLKSSQQNVQKHQIKVPFRLYIIVANMPTLVIRNCTLDILLTALVT